MICFVAPKVQWAEVFEPATYPSGWRKPLHPFEGMRMEVLARWSLGRVTYEPRVELLGPSGHAVVRAVTQAGSESAATLGVLVTSTLMLVELVLLARLGAQSLRLMPHLAQ